jgi:hypothetical protein
MINLIDFIRLSHQAWDQRKENQQDGATSEGEFELGARYGVTTVTELSFNGEPE